MALAILLAAAEMVTITTVLDLGGGGRAHHRAACSGSPPGLGGYEQIGIFAALSIVFFFVGRALVARFGQPGGDEAAPSTARAQQLVGREGVVASFERTEGKVTVDGVPWPARLDAGAATPAPATWCG